MWGLENVMARGGHALIVYSETTQVDGEDHTDTLTVTHDQDAAQSDREWHANIRREIVADLSGLNKSLPAEIDITSRVI